MSRKIRNLTKLLQKLSFYNFNGYAEADSDGNLVITIPGVADLLRQADREEGEEK